MLRRYSTATTTTNNNSQLNSQKQQMLPDGMMSRIGAMLPPLDRMRLQQTCKKYNQLFSKWDDVEAMEIRCEEYGYCTESVGPVRKTNGGFHYQLPSMISVAKKKAISAKKAKSFHVRLIYSNGNAFRLRTLDERTASKTLRIMLARQSALDELTLWDGCLSSEFCSVLSKMTTVTTLRLWNSSRYFEKKKPSGKKLIQTLLALPSLKQLLVLDSTAAAYSADSCRRAVFSKSLAAYIKAPIENLQLTGLHLPLRTMEIFSENLGRCCKRLAIGCTFGKESKRLLYLKALKGMKLINDLDLPPFIFHLSEIAVADGVVQKLFQTLPLKALGFRHYNSSVLFRFIETQLPLSIRLIRVHHNSNRIPNFAALGQTTLNEDLSGSVAEKKSSVVSRYSILSTSRSSIGSTNNDISSASAVVSPFAGLNGSKEGCNKDLWSFNNNSYSNSSSSSSGNSTNTSNYGSNASTLTTTVSTVVPSNQQPMETNEDQQTGAKLVPSIAATLAARRLTIFAIAEERTKRRTQRLRKRTYCGVDVIYSQESLNSQEILGRMASPMQSPHVYSKSLTSKCTSNGTNAKRDTRLRIIKGDLVKPIPLSSLGMESDYELSDWED